MDEPVSKAEFRRRAALRRAAVHAAGSDAAERLAALWSGSVGGLTVAGYWPIRSEIDPRPLMTRLAGEGARLALPVTPPRGSGAPLSFRLLQDGRDLAPGHFGVPEPAADAAEVEPDLVLAPLLAFDRRGGRLGYGAGHYDRTLERLRARGAVRAVGLAYADQEVPATPADANDQRLDAILTEKGYIPLEEDF